MSMPAIASIITPRRRLSSGESSVALARGRTPHCAKIRPKLPGGCLALKTGVTRTEYYRTEFEAMKRVRQLLEEGDHHGIAVHDGMGEVLTGIRLELKLGMQVAD
jgi:hypothetical protein